MPEAELKSQSVKTAGTLGGRALTLPALDSFPWWAAILVVGGIVAVFVIATSADYLSIITLLSSGIYLTVYVALLSYFFALILGLIAGLMRVSRNPVLYTIGTLYVEVIRGIPLLVQILYFFYVFVPLWNKLDLPSPFAEIFRSEVNDGIAALAIGYGAYLAEVYRAGIQAIPRGQMEAARSLGMSYVQAMRYVILPQAIRIILPPLGNEFISMLKDSALVYTISVKELTFWTRQRSANTFRPLEHWTIAALLYLAMTLSLSTVVRYIERKFSVPK